MSWNPPPFKSAQEVFEQCRQTSILLGRRHPDWVSRTQHYVDRLTPFTTVGQFPRVLLAQPDPIELLAGFMAACMMDCPVFLGNPNWSPPEWQQVLDLTQPHQIWGTVPISASPLETPATRSGWIMIPTGGSSGRIKFAIHTWQTLTTAVEGFQRFFCGSSPIHSCCVLPLYHVSGLMQFLRSFLTEGHFVIMPFADLLSEPSAQNHLVDSLSRPDPADFFLSLVPTQLQRLLQQPTCIPWLQTFRTIFLGGAPAWPALLEQARHYQLNLAPTYGMTETAAQVATLQPHDFLQGYDHSGQPLPHIHLEIHDATKQVLDINQTGNIAIQTQSLFLGYYPHPDPVTIWATDDVGYLNAQGDLHVVGRSSRKIISGGENIFPEEVEAAIYGSGLVQEVYVLGVSDHQWGEAVTALYVPLHEAVTAIVLKAALEHHLSRYKHPKRWICVEALPRNSQGKLNHELLEQWAS